MSEITAIEPQKRKEDRFNIFIDGKFAFGLDAETLVKSGLKVGQEISEGEIKKLVFENEIRKLMDKALRFLSFRPRSERELRDHLRKKIPTPHLSLPTSPNSIIDTVIDRLTHLGYINDEDFARWWIEQRQTHRPRGAQLIRSELYQKGIIREIIDQVLPENVEGEVGQALQVAKKKLRSPKDLESREFRQKIGQYLARRGFDWETIKEALARLVDTSSQKG